VWNVVDLRSSHNFELAMRVHTDIQNNDILHSDLNGFQYMTRKRHDKLTLQGNVYPMSSGAYIQDSKLRFSVLSAQSLGVASLVNSQIQVFLDRHLDQDDNLGLSEAINDNLIVSSQFIMFFEAVRGRIESSASADFPSLLSSLLSNGLLYPIVKLVVTNGNFEMVNEMAFSSKKYPCDLHLVNMRSMQTQREEPRRNEVGLILHRMVYDDCSHAFIGLPRYIMKNCMNSLEFKFQDFFEFLGSAYKSMRVSNRLLTFRKKRVSTSLIQKDDFVLKLIEPMQIEAFLVNF
jgi:alpha-mannosidase II